jgi:hypothetical protein
VGVGDFLDAAFTLEGPIPAGHWHLVGDGIVFTTTDVTYSIIYRPSSGDQTLANVTTHFDEPMGPNQFDAQPFDADLDLPEVPAKAGDQLVLRFSAAGSGSGTAYVPNDFSTMTGRFPSITLPR